MCSKERVTNLLDMVDVPWIHCDLEYLRLPVQLDRLLLQLDEIFLPHPLLIEEVWTSCIVHLVSAEAELMHFSHVHPVSVELMVQPSLARAKLLGR